MWATQHNPAATCRTHLTVRSARCCSCSLADRLTLVNTGVHAACPLCQCCVCILVCACRINTSSPVAQALFDQGLLLTYNFNRPEVRPSTASASRSYATAGAQPCLACMVLPVLQPSWASHAVR